ncbi:MAG: RNA methyltransferase, partial [Caulobacterales bacterium]|nr:RNA methyltransferase [Caulobacterales bacterium]
TSLQNNLVKLARALDRKKSRNEHGLFRAEGARHVLEGLECGWQLYGLLYAKAVENRPHIKELLQKVKNKNIKIGCVSDSVLESITHRDNAQSVVGIFQQSWANLDDFNDENLLIALERPKDPGNLGTIIRTLDSVGGKGIILLEEACDPFSVEAIRASMGSSFSVKVARAGIDEFLNWQKKQNFHLVGTSLKGSDLHTKTKMGKKTILLMGNEQSGIDDNLANQCNALIKLPMKGRADSLNLAIATGICLYEIWRQRDFDGANQ